MKPRFDSVHLQASFGFLCSILFSGSLDAQWTGTGAGGSGTDFNNTANWNAATINGSFVNNNTASTITLSANHSLGGGLTFFNGAAPIQPIVTTLDGTVGGTLEVLTLGGNVTLNKSAALAPAITGTWTSGSSTITVSSAAGLQVGQVISGGAGIVPGTIITGISGTTVTLSNPTYGNQASAANLTVGGGVLFGGDMQVSLGGASRTFTANAGSGANNGAITLNSQVSGTVSIFIGGGTLNLTNSNNALTFSGAVKSSGSGLINYSSDGALGSGTALEVNNSSLAYTGSTASVLNRTLGNFNSGTLNNNSTGGASSTITLTGAVTLNGGNLTLGGSNKTALNEISGNIGGTGNLTVGSGISGDFSGASWKLSGTNTNTGTVTVSTGTLEFASIANVGGGASNLGAPTTVSAGTITLAGGGFATLRYTGGGHSSDRQIAIADAGSSNTATITANGSGALTLGTGVVYNGTSQADKNRPLVLDGTSTAANSIGNILFNFSRTSGANGNATVSKNGTGLWVMTGSNAYNLGGGGTAGTYTTSVNAGTLRLASAGAIPGGIGAAGGTSLLTINGGVLELAAGDFNRGTGTTATTVNLQNGGFSAFGGNRNVNLGGASAAVTWGAGNFMTGTGAVLQLSSALSDSTITFQNPINLGSSGTNTRTIQVNDGSATVDAVLSGNLTASGGVQSLAKTGNGTLHLTGDYSAAGGTIVSNGGLLSISGKISGSVGVSSSQFPQPVGTLTLTNDANDFTGSVASGAQGNINFTSVANEGNASSLGAATGANSVIQLNNSSLTFIGTSAQSSNRGWLVNNTGSIIHNAASASSTLNLSGDASVGTNATLRLQGSNTGNNTFSGLITGTNAGVFKRDGGTWRLTNDANSFSGNVGGDGGTLEFTSVANSGVNSSLGSGSAISVNNMDLSFVGSSAQSTNRSVTIDNTPYLSANGSSSSATITYSGTVQNASAGPRTLNLGGSNSGQNTISGVISNGGGNLGINKTGSGIWVLSGNNSYSGTTTVSQGSLVINGNQSTAMGNVSVSTGATLAGSGTVGGATTISDGAFLSPGQSTGLLTFGSNLSITGATSEITIEIVGLNRGDLVNGYDAVDVGGTLGYNGILSLNMASAVANASFNLFDFSSQSGNLSSVVFSGGYYTGSFTLDSGVWTGTGTGLGGSQQFTFNQSTGVLTVVPEPRAAVLGLIGLLALLRRRVR